MALKNLLEKKLLPTDYVKISQLYTTIKSFKMNSVVALFFRLIKPLLLKNISGSNPSLLLFDIYRIGYLCSLKS